MKRFITIFSIFLCVLLCFDTTNVSAQTQPKILTQGIYNARDTNLLIGTPINVSITSTNSKAIILIIDPTQTIEALVRLNNQIPKQILPPLNYDSLIVIITSGSVTFS